MSHFTVMVVTDTPEEVEKVLQPYHEYECTGIKDEYVSWIDKHDQYLEEYNTDMIPMICKKDVPLFTKYGKIADKFMEPDDPNNPCSATSLVLPEGWEARDIPATEVYDTVEEYMKDWHGYTDPDHFRDGRFGEMTNPSAKWDWWVIGGRWSGFLLHKNGTEVDQARKSEINFLKKRKRAEIEAGTTYDRFHAIINGREYVSWKAARDVLYEGNIDAAREFYNNQEVVKDLKQEDVWCEADEFLLSRKEYTRKHGNLAVRTFAIIHEGEWYEKGEMGWFGICADEKETWNDEFHDIFETIPDDKLITIVDCHI